MADIVSAIALKSTPSSRRETLTKMMREFIEELKSTPSSRRETAPETDNCHSKRSLNPLPPRGGRRDRYSALIYY